ncbi:MAG: hypothetical protein JWN84_4405 [Nocardioides sp.]|nr:hypothetical protein [Nocardioides sp.]
MTQGSTPPGWYDDGSGARRWWDGSAWTEHTQAALPPPPSQPPSQPPYGAPTGATAYGAPTPPRKGKGLLIGALAGVAALVVAVVVVLALVLGDDGDDDTDRASDDTTSEASPSSPAAPSSTSTPTPTEESSTPSEEPTSAEPVDPADPGQVTCGQIRSMTTQELVDLLDRAAQLEVDRSGDQDAQDYLDLPASQKQTFAAFLPAACEGESDDTKLDDVEDF